MSKKLAVNLNQRERMIINDVCSLVNVQDRSRVVKELAITKATEFLKQVTEQRMAQREKLLKESIDNDKGNGGDVRSDTNAALGSEDSDSNVVAAEESSVVDAGGSKESSGES